MPYQHLSARERMHIFYLDQMGLTHREIGRRLGRAHTTISRELRRNKRPIYCYCDQAAQMYANQRKAKPRHRRRHSNARLRTYVINKLQKGWSPEIISHFLKRDYPYRRQYRVHTETIYQWVYKDALDGGNLYQSLVRCHKKRRKQRPYGSLRGLIPNRRDISERPTIVDRRRRYGDWEGDTMVGHRHQGRLVTHVERKSRFLLAARIDNGTSAAFNQASLRLYKLIPPSYRKTLTLDNGSENAGFATLEQHLGLTVFFAQPYASWERGTNENTNGLLRRYFPKSTNFKTIKQSTLDHVVDLLNHRPRKCLNYRTPFEVFNNVMGGALGT